MNLLPFLAKVFEVLSQGKQNPRKAPSGKPVVFANFDWTARAVQIEYCLTSRAYYVHMGRTMIVRINYYAQSTESEDRRHVLIVSYNLSD